MSALLLPAAPGAALLALVHVVTPALRFLEGPTRSVWLSMVGGVSVAYIFVHLLPELAAGQDQVGSRGDRRGPNRLSGRRCHLERAQGGGARGCVKLIQVG